MDHWDPALLNPLAKTRPILLFDSYGVGNPLETPPTFAAWADVAASLVKTLGIKQVDVLGFSMGGMVAQMLALNHPEIVRLIIPSSGKTCLR